MRGPRAVAKREWMRERLAEAWRATVEGPYARGEVNSEASLTACFHAALVGRFAALEQARTVFVAPRVVFGRERVRRYPDLLVCHRRSVVAVVELKYAPRAEPATRKDVATLSRFAACDGEIELEHRRYLGAARLQRSFVLRRDALLCWAGVDRAPERDLAPELAAAGRRFLQFDARTAARTCPRVMVREGGVARPPAASPARRASSRTVAR